MRRDIFLSQHWNPYPAMPADALAAGRVRQITFQDSAVEILLERQNTLTSHQVLKSDWLELLIVGDVIAIMPDSEVLLLAPYQVSGVWPSFPYERQLQWQQFQSQVRHFFWQQAFLELKTPSLVPCPGTEPSLDVFSTELKIGSRRQKLYLPTSPELHLKKALAKGAEKIFEIAPCYRNGEMTSRHLPEFLMLEWYRSYDGLMTIQKDVVNLVHYLCEALRVQKPLAIRVMSVAELFQQYCDFKLQPETSLEELRTLAARLSVNVDSAESIDDYFFLIFTEKIESQLPAEEFIFVEKYPPYQAALARLTADGWGDRFEAYWKGYELANAFHELNDPIIQRQRSHEDLQKKKDLGKEEIPFDEDFFRHLEAGLPPSAGIALGLERLFMCLYNIREISETKWYSV